MLAACWIGQNGPVRRAPRTWIHPGGI